MDRHLQRVQVGLAPSLFEEGEVMAEKDLELIGITRRFGDFVAVDGIDLEVGQGEFLAIMGPSGCGKTTLLRIMAGLESMTSGRMLVKNRDLASVPIHKRPTRLVWQDYALFPTSTCSTTLPSAPGLHHTIPLPCVKRSSRWPILSAWRDFSTAG